MADFLPTAKVIADSLSPLGHRLTTMEVTMHRYMLPEFNTHRMFSRNSASSRAIPVHRMMARVAETPALPIGFRGEQKGMQGGPYLVKDVQDQARAVWLSARDEAVAHAERLVELGVHKSIVNRLLEPFLPHTVIVSATDWRDFFAQRCNDLAQDDIRWLATKMQDAYEFSDPRELDYGAWHLPYVTLVEQDQLGEVAACQVSAARCARVSYLTHDGRRDPAEDINLYWRLVNADPPHASPLEHVATPALNGTGNFHGWRQLRHLVLREPQPPCEHEE